MSFQPIKLAVTLFAIAALALGLAACGDDGEASSSPASETVTQKKDNAEGAGNGGGVWNTEESAFGEEHPGSARYGSPPLEFEADPSGKIAFTVDEVTAKEGNVTIEFRNPQSTPHNVAIEALPSHGRVVTKTITDEDDYAAKTITLNTDEKFIFYCTVPGHREAGMEGVVKVKPA